MGIEMKSTFTRAAQMLKRQAIFLSVLSALFPLAARAQGTMEFGAVHAGAIGLGAGLAASREHGQVVRRSYEAMLQAQQTAAAQTKAINQYMTLGCQHESKKQWAEAEKSFNYVLKVVALRDGPGSIKSVPALQHLVTVTKQQGKLTEAIDFQKTVVAFTKSVKVPDQQSVLNSQINLSSLFIQNNDYTNAEPILRETISTNAAYESMPPEKRRHTLAMYAKVLRQLHKDSEADAIEASAMSDGGKSDGAKLDGATPTALTDTSSQATSSAISVSATSSPATKTGPTTSQSSNSMAASMVNSSSQKSIAPAESGAGNSGSKSHHGVTDTTANGAGTIQGADPLQNASSFHPASTTAHAPLSTKLPVDAAPQPTSEPK